jgi:hypothetical protein
MEMSLASLLYHLQQQTGLNEHLSLVRSIHVAGLQQSHLGVRRILHMVAWAVGGCASLKT